MLWNELVKLALLGTERSNLTPAMATELQGYGIDTSKEITEVILESAALVGALQKAGYQPEEWTKPLLPPSPEEELVNCSKKSANHLSLILSGRYLPALGEFVETMRDYHKCLPHETLPELLDKCVKDAALWQQLKATIGTRGKWLIPLNPNWHKLNVIISPEKWQTGTIVERVAILTELRTENPAEGLKLLLTTWAEDGLQEKKAFLKILKMGLSDIDEVFLEECLDFSRKEVRVQSAQLLSLLPNSQLQKRILEAIKIGINIGKDEDNRGKPVIILPDTKNKALIRDGINPKKKWKRGSESTGMLKQMIALMPPEQWEIHLQKTPKEIIDFFTQSEWAMMLVEAVAEAAALHKSTIWMETLLLFWLENYYKKQWTQLDIKPILGMLPHDVFNKIIVQKLKAIKTLPEEHSPLIQLLQKEGYVWGEFLTKMIMEQLKDWIKNNASYSWSGFQYRNMLKNAAYSVHPKMERWLHQFWLGEAYAWAGWEKDIQQFLTIMSFRKEMIAELEMDHD